MENYNLSSGINESIQQCLDNGAGEIQVGNNVIIQTEWESLDSTENYDVVTIYMLEDGVIKLRYQEEETKVEA